MTIPSTRAVRVGRKCRGGARAGAVLGLTLEAQRVSSSKVDLTNNRGRGLLSAPGGLYEVPTLSPGSTRDSHSPCPPASILAIRFILGQDGLRVNNRVHTRSADLLRVPTVTVGRDLILVPRGSLTHGAEHLELEAPRPCRVSPASLRRGEPTDNRATMV